MSRAWLAIEASTASGGVAVGSAESLLAEIVIGTQARHSAALVPAIDFALQHAALTAADLTGIVVGSGPGSFTGVRVAAATAKGMARALGVPLYAASSLAALALSIEAGDRPVCALFDARRGEVYAGCYRAGDARLEVVLPPRVCTAAEAVAAAAEIDALCAGEGAWAYEDVVRGAGLHVAGSRHAVPRPAALLRLLRAEGGAIPVETPSWQPDYLRASGAERARSSNARS